MFFFSFEDSFLLLTWVKISEFFILHIHCSLLRKRHARKLVDLSCGQTSCGPSVFVLPPFFMDVVENLIHLFLSLAGVILTGVFLLKLFYMLLGHFLCCVWDWIHATCSGTYLWRCRLTCLFFAVSCAITLALASTFLIGTIICTLLGWLVFAQFQLNLTWCSRGA